VPELPDVCVYVERLEALLVGEPLEAVRLKSLFLVRTVEPPLMDAVGRRVVGAGRIGKRIVLSLADELHLVVHLMIAGRLRWRRRGAGHPGKAGLCAFDFPQGTLMLTEAASRKRASLHVVSGDSALAEFTERLRAEVGSGFPDKVTAFRPDMAVHGKYGEPCPQCDAPVQRILYAENESNYCVRCQTGGRVLADRVLSRLMKDDWPSTLEELEDLGRST
jgi:formamidopyrimidine-DNA glycosylase